jgi:L-lactate dehydrogenase (cytochrome)
LCADRAWAASRLAHLQGSAVQLKDCQNIGDLRELARRRLPHPIFHYVDGGAEDETTLRRNTLAFNDIQFVPRCLIDVAEVNTATRVLGQDLAWPVMCSPTGASRFCHADGELAIARAAGRTGTLYALSMMSTFGLEEVAAIPGAKMFQLYLFKDRDVTSKLIERCRQSGYKAMCLTVDTAVVGKRERDLRTGWGVPIKLSPSALVSFIRRPRWLFGQARKGRLSMPAVAALTGNENIVSQTQFIGKQLDPTVTWRDVRKLVELWNGPFAIKGILSVEDALRAIDVGATAVIVSNHGGRQLDGAVAAIEVLPEIVRTVGHQIEVILDGGVRRGVHILKALMLGAKACSIGRPYLYGLGAGGEAGVQKAFDILRTELIRAMQLTGCTDVKHIEPDRVRQ